MLDPKLFDPSAIDPETAAFNAQLEKLLEAGPWYPEQTPEELRALREAGKGIAGPIVLVEQARERSIPGPAGPVPVRLFVPDEVAGVYLHIHGGGWVLGRAHHRDPALWALANACKVAVVSVDYRLAPEHPYPAGPDDCEAAALWLVRNARSEFGADRLVIGGESAGAHLSAVTLLRLRDRHGITSFAGAVLSFGAFDLSGTPSVRRWGQRRLVLNTSAIQWFTDHFVPERLRRDPDVSPLYADLSRMPPALFSVGTLDPLLDDTLFMHARWLAAGNRAELAVYPGAAHGFDRFPIRVGRDATVRIHQFIAKAVGKD